MKNKSIYSDINVFPMSPVYMYIHVVHKISKNICQSNSRKLAFRKLNDADVKYKEEYCSTCDRHTTDLQILQLEPKVIKPLSSVNGSFIT